MQLEMLKYELEGVSEWMHIVGDNAFVDIGEGWKFYKEVLENNLKNRNVAVQAGGYCGIFPRCLANMFQRVYTFEPDPVNFFCLTNNTKVGNVIKFQAAVGEKKELISVNRVHPNNAGMNRVEPNSNGIIPTLRIDDLGLETCDLIMLDIEGYEIKALKGAIYTIETYQPLISVEDTNSQIEDFLKIRGYREVTKVFRDTYYAV